MSVHSSTNAMQIETGLEKTVENIRADSLVASEEIGSAFKSNDSSPTIEIDGIQETSEEETEAISERLITVKQTTEEIIKQVSTIENTEKTENFIGKLQNTVESVEQVTSEIKEKSDFCNILEIIPEEIISEETTIDNNTMDSYLVVANDVTLDTAPPKPIRRSSCNKGFESEIQQNLKEINKSSEVTEDISEINLPTQPTPPPRRLSVVPSEISNSALGINSLYASSTTQNTSSNSVVSTPSHCSTLNSSHFKRLTLPYRSSRGRLSFPTLPRNALPPTMEEVSGRKKTKSMFSWLGGDSSKKKNREVLDSVSEGLRKIYKQKLYPLEEHFKFHEFHSPALDDPDFDAKPMILLVGQYSTGKTTFIRYLLEQDFPGIRIGPEPTTDRFIAVMHGEEEGVVPGNALVVDAKKQFRALSGFGNAFLNRFQCSSLNNQVLESVTIVDTPGILSGEKQRIDRGYDFTGVLEWFAERVDRIILLFDAHKLDISDEFKRCIEALSGNEDKIRIVLNKSDMVDHQQLMRVYGALMWSLGKVFKTPEVSRVYIGSFWDHPLHYDINRRLFQDEQHDLFQDLQALPRNAALRKLNDLIKRARLAKVHAYIIAELRKQMPSMIGKDKKKKELIQNLDKIFEQLQREHNISPGDFPDVNKMREKLQTQDFTKFNPIKPKLLEVVDGMLASDIARLMAQIPKEEAQISAALNGNSVEQPTVKGGAFTQAQEAETPFGFGRGEGFDKGADETEWVVSRERNQADTTFESLGPIDGFISGRVAKEHMVKSKLPNSVLGKIWKLADVDRDGQLDADEFALANYLINLKLEGHELPLDLPKHLVPPSKRNQDTVYPKLDDE